MSKCWTTTFDPSTCQCREGRRRVLDFCHYASQIHLLARAHLLSHPMIKICLRPSHIALAGDLDIMSSSSETSVAKPISWFFNHAHRDRERRG